MNAQNRWLTDRDGDWWMELYDHTWLPLGDRDRLLPHQTGFTREWLEQLYGPMREEQSR